MLTGRICAAAEDLPSFSLRNGAHDGAFGSMVQKLALQMWLVGLPEQAARASSQTLGPAASGLHPASAIVPHHSVLIERAWP